jgi:hypothetical protein
MAMATQTSWRFMLTNVFSAGLEATALRQARMPDATTRDHSAMLTKIPASISQP